MPSPEALADYNKGRSWIFFFLYCGLIFFLSHQPGNPNLVLPFQHFDKVVHFIEYMVFAVFLSRALMYSGFRKTAGIVLASAIFYGITDEIHQSFVPLRNSDWRDLIADSAGASFGILMFQLLLPANRRDPWIMGSAKDAE